MNNNSFICQKLSAEKFLIIFLTHERPDTHLERLVCELRKCTSKANLYFDFLVNNGLNDRFYSAKFENSNLQLNSFKKIKNNFQYIEVSNQYFSNNWDIVENNSVLTKIQKSFYKKKLKFHSLTK